MVALINPSGRLVWVDSEKEAEYWLSQPHFSRATEEQIQEDVLLRKQKADIKAKQQNAPATGIFMATVSVGGKDGYGRGAELIKRELEKLGVPVTRYNAGQSFALIFHSPTAIGQVDSPYKFVYTMFESTKIPDEWKPYLDEADRVAVPSKWCQEVFGASGVKTELIPFGYDDTVFTYKPRENKRAEGKVFTFLHYNAFNIRKGFREVFAAFTKEFEPDEPVRLVLKTTASIAPIPISKALYPNIDVLYNPVPEHELVNILYDSDCFVFPSMGEGFGITPVEAMATGIPAIVPNAHGISEYFDDSCMYEVKIGYKRPAIYSRYKPEDTGDMFVCDVDHLRQQMRWAYEHQDEVIRKGKIAAEYVKKWSIKNTAKMIKDAYDEAMLLPNLERKIKNILPLERVA